MVSARSLGVLRRLNDLLGYPELGELVSYTHGEVLQLIENLHRWGSFLLDAAHRTVQPERGANRYGRLLEAVKYSKWAIPAMRDAAADLFYALPADDGIATEHEGDLSVPALPPAAPAQSAPSEQPHIQQAPAAAPVVASGAEEGLLSVEEAARIANANKGTMSRWRKEHGLASSDGIRIDRSKLYKFLETHKRRKIKPARSRGGMSVR